MHYFCDKLGNWSPGNNECIVLLSKWRHELPAFSIWKKTFFNACQWAAMFLVSEQTIDATLQASCRYTKMATEACAQMSPEMKKQQMSDRWRTCANGGWAEVHEIGTPSVPWPITGRQNPIPPCDWLMWTLSGKQRAATGNFPALFLYFIPKNLQNNVVNFQAQLTTWSTLNPFKAKHAKFGSILKNATLVVQAVWASVGVIIPLANTAEAWKFSFFICNKI